MTDIIGMFCAADECAYESYVNPKNWTFRQWEIWAEFMNLGRYKRLWRGIWE